MENSKREVAPERDNFGRTSHSDELVQSVETPDKALQSWELFVATSFTSLIIISIHASLSCGLHSRHSLYIVNPLMAPYDFDASDTDSILRSSDGKELRVHRLIFSLSSPVFQGMFSLPQPTGTSSEIPSVDLPEPSDILQPFIQYLYPRSPPVISDISMWEALYAIADKYAAEVVTDPLRDMLIPRFLETSPLRVYALASRWSFEEEAKIASTRTLTIDIFKDFPREDAGLMGGIACQRLYLLHFNRREAARALVTDHPLPTRSDPSCQCPLPSYSRLVPSIYQRVATRPWLTAEELYEEVARWDYPSRCNSSCRNAVTNMHAYLSSILKGISELPRTI